ncbi:DUF58 domain-containing protein [Streptomyces avicenniae]|uniref:DUF58 domain-containing protein n=1 Tax=Streptomyces avicenniae TaxID=500153 RepID=UPI00069B2A8F|nr:DUF58 domain-containing protein [Streptomyces avicenniae]
MAAPVAAGTGVDERESLRAAFGGLTTRGRSFVAAGGAATLCSYALGQPDLLRVGVLLAVLPLLCVLVLHGTRSRVTATRRLTPERVPAGGDARVHLRVENVGRLPSGLLLLQDRVPYMLGPRPRFVLDRIEPGGRREVTYRVRSDMRGRYPLGPLELRLTDPFGMAELSRSFSTSDTMTVLPYVEPLPPARLGGNANGAGDGARRGLAAVGEDDIIPRDYRHGDDLRRVHWRSTAHRGALMVRREEQPRRTQCTVLLDTRRSAYLGAGPESAFERAVSGAASMVRHLADQGYEVRLLTDTGLVVPRPGAEPGDVLERVGVMMDVLAGVEPSAGESLEAAEQVLRPSDSGLVVAFTGALDDARSAALGRLRPRQGAALAFVVGGQRDAAAEARQLAAVRAAGWAAQLLGAGVPLGHAWQQAASEQSGDAAGRYG